MRRIADEPAYVLHRYDWSESSLILELLTRGHGRIAVVAKGAKKPSSNFRPVLLPLQPLHVAFGGDAEIRNLRSAEWQGGQVMPTGEALLSGYYLNELLLLREVGLLPSLDAQTATLAQLEPTQRYTLRAEGGLLEAEEADGRVSLPGAQWIALQQALDDPAPFEATLRTAAPMGELKPQLRALLHYHCGVSTLRTRQLMMDLQAL
jgi:DNA repair protein RecO (recombination protein O)